MSKIANGILDAAAKATPSMLSASVLAIIT